ncbi:cytochrome P450 [Streptomyces gamaensis]|uniref:Cytochrome P450 n=1 Tax=Streptomyces gamaensis TaxID=1763542 RepID=A0ABW0Z1X1_9ACTN
MATRPVVEVRPFPVTRRRARPDSTSDPVMNKSRRAVTARRLPWYPRSDEGRTVDESSRSGPVSPPAGPLYTPLHPDTLQDPYRAFRLLRENDPVHWHAELDSWVLTRYEDCVAVLRDAQRFRSDFRSIGEEVPQSALSVQMLDPPEHAAIRHLLVGAVREQRFGGLRTEIRELVRSRLAEASTGGTFDFVERVARPVALRTICRVLGVDEPGGAEFEAMSNAIVRSMDGGLDGSRLEPGARARAELSELLAAWAGRPAPGTFIDRVMRRRERYGVPAPLVINSLRAMLHAGYESASRLLGNAVSALVADPQAGAKALHAGVPDAAIDELVRFDPPVQADARVCATDCGLGGRRLARGSVVTVLIGAANHDPAVFTDPGRLLPDRSANPHLGFGKGVHACLGAQLARVEMAAVLGALAQYDDRGLALRPAGDPVREPTATLRGLSRLPVRLEAGAAGGEQ